MRTIHIDSIAPTKSGKSYLIKSGADSFLAKLDSGLNGKAGQTIEAEVETSEFQGKTLLWVGKWSAKTQSQPALAPEPKDNVSPWYMPFVSNVVAHAIQSGAITESGQIADWADRAYLAAINVKAKDGATPF